MQDPIGKTPHYDNIEMIRAFEVGYFINNMRG